MNEPLFEGNTSFNVLGILFSSKLDCGSYIVSIAKTASKKIETLICSIKFLSPEVPFCLFKSTILPCLEYCWYVRVDAPSCYLDKLDKILLVCHAPSCYLDKLDKLQ